MKWRDRLIIFLAAIAVRLFFGYLFFGSVDVRCFLSMTHCTLHHDLLSFPLWNYFPILPHFLWFVGMLSGATELPFAFCSKIIPTLFDGMIALLIYDMVSLKRPGYGMLSGMLYALCPVPLIIVSIHGQWDSLFLFFLLLSIYIRDYFEPSPSGSFLFGVTYAISFLLKPASLLFVPFFFTPYRSFLTEIGNLKWLFVAGIAGKVSCMCVGFGLIKWYALTTQELTALLLSPLVMGGSLVIALVLVIATVIAAARAWPTLPLSLKKYCWLQSSAVAGAVSVTCMSFVLLSQYGFNIIALCDTILRYCNQGVQLMGLPFSPCCASGVGLMLKNRFLLMGFIAFIAWRYYHGAYSGIQALLITFTCMIGLSGICPQYLMWLVPVLLISGLYSQASIYVLFVSSFYLLFYSNPWGNPAMPYQNMLSFASLDSWSWFMPSTVFMSAGWGLLITLLGNLLIPVYCLMICYQGMQRQYLPQGSIHQEYNSLWYYFVGAGSITLIAEWCRHAILPEHYERFAQIVSDPLDGYVTTVFHNKVTAFYQDVSGFHVISLLFFVAVFWSLYVAQQTDAS